MRVLSRRTRERECAQSDRVPPTVLQYRISGGMCEKSSDSIITYAALCGTSHRWLSQGVNTTVQHDMELSVQGLPHALSGCYGIQSKHHKLSASCHLFTDGPL